MKRLLLFLIFFNTLLFSTDHNNHWIKEQITQDLKHLNHPINTKKLKELFYDLSEKGHQALYCKIRNNKITWERTKGSDEWRVPHIFNYFKILRTIFFLPDMDFILSTEDGFHRSSHLPIFAFAKKKTANNVLLIPDFEMLWELVDHNKNFERRCNKNSNLHPWKNKDSLAFFRGCSTGGCNPALPDFGNARFKTVLFSHNHPNLVDSKFNIVFQKPITDLLNSLNIPIKGAEIAEHFKYKYLLDIDGNSCTYSRCRWILLSNSALLKVISDKEQWYYKTLKPWINYVPINQDLSDLSTNIQYLKSNDDKAHKIAVNGRNLGKNIFSKQVVDQYVFELLKAYSKFVEID
jgi:hypothetical protein